MNFLILAIIIFLGSLSGGNGFGLDKQLSPIVKNHVFSLAGWEISNIYRELFSKPAINGDSSNVINYFKLSKQARDLNDRIEQTRESALKETDSMQTELDRINEILKSKREEVEQVLERQIRDTLEEQGIYSPWENWKISFPPLNFELAEPPYILVISPRDRIEKINSIMLQPDLTMDEINDIEKKVDQLNLSALVVGIGGLGATYPTFVADDMDLQSTIKAATEEWLHQYLAFRPLGFRYVLDLTGLVRNYDIARMNETVASMVSEEIGNLVYNKYYRNPEVDDNQSTEEPTRESDNTTPTGPVFDFNAEMREVRRQVDQYLAQGQVEIAEQYMREKQDCLAEQGYYIRKLNQAYFAFYGTYTESPTSIDPIGMEMRQIRNESLSLKAFLDTVSVMTDLEELKVAAGS
jgi:hypothetical protein